MIKLFWNTHNQPKLSENNKDSTNYIWGAYHKKNSDEWIYEILKKVKYSVIDNEQDLETDDILIIVDSSIENKIKKYNELKIICSKIFLFHLGDETGILDYSPVYKNCDYVWRTFCSNKYFSNEQVKCIPIGYKSGISSKSLQNRKYKWAFIGTPHKSSRHDLLYHFSHIKEFYSYKTEKFNSKLIPVEEMSKILSLTEFLPCPNGFVHPETYRLYEALECGCIPIVENAYKYYERLFPGNPFIKVDKWIEAVSTIKGWSNEQISSKRNECVNWWNKYKNEMQEFIKNKIV